MPTEKQFETYLWGRRFEPASTNLAERIIAAAKDKPVVRVQGIMDYLQDALEILMPQPKPAYAIAFMLIIGILIGTNLPVQAEPGEFELAFATDEGEL